MTKEPIESRFRPCYAGAKPGPHKDLTAMQPNKIRADLWMDVALMAFLIGFDVAARLLPHAPGVWPVAASALFAGRTFRIPALRDRAAALALIVPLAATAFSNVALANDDWRVTLAVYAAMLVPALAGMLIRHWRGALPVVAAMVSSLAGVLCRHQLRGLGLQRHVSDDFRGPGAMLRRGAAVPG